MSAKQAPQKSRKNTLRRVGKQERQELAILHEIITKMEDYETSHREELAGLLRTTLPDRLGAFEAKLQDFHNLPGGQKVSMEHDANIYKAFVAKLNDPLQFTQSLYQRYSEAMASVRQSKSKAPVSTDGPSTTVASTPISQSVEEKTPEEHGMNEATFGMLMHAGARITESPKDKQGNAIDETVAERERASNQLHLNLSRNLRPEMYKAIKGLRKTSYYVDAYARLDIMADDTLNSKSPYTVSDINWLKDLLAYMKDPTHGLGSALVSVTQQLQQTYKGFQSSLSDYVDLQMKISMLHSVKHRAERIFDAYSAAKSNHQEYSLGDELNSLSKSIQTNLKSDHMQKHRHSRFFEGLVEVAKLIATLFVGRAIQLAMGKGYSPFFHKQSQATYLMQASDDALQRSPSLKRRAASSEA